MPSTKSCKVDDLAAHVALIQKSQVDILSQLQAVVSELESLKRIVTHVDTDLRRWGIKVRFW